nr:hypothetical protein CFP56_55721 [Quercus suber]
MSFGLNRPYRRFRPKRPELSRVGASRLRHVAGRGPDAARKRGQRCLTRVAASGRVRPGCGASGAASVLSRLSQVHSDAQNLA